MARTFLSFTAETPQALAATITAAFSALLNRAITRIDFQALDPGVGHHYRAMVTHDASAVTLAAPYQVVGFTKDSLGDLAKAATDFVTAHPADFVSPLITRTVSSNIKPGEHAGMMFWCTDATGGANNFAEGGLTLPLASALGGTGTALGVGGTPFTATGGTVPRSAADRDGDEVDAEGFPSIQAALDRGAAVSRPVRLLSGKTYDISTGTLSIDVDKTSLLCYGVATIQCGVPTSGYSINLVGSNGSGGADYPTRYKRVRCAMKGINLLGSTDSGALHAGSGIKVGDGTNNVSFVSIEHVAVRGFANTVTYSDHAWKVHFVNCLLEWGDIVTPVAPEDFGECMSFSDCFISDGVEIKIYTGDWQFDRCSFDNCKTRVMGDARVFHRGAHYENPGNTTATWEIASVESVSGLFASSSFMVNFSGENVTSPLFSVADTNTSRGVVLRDFNMALGGHYIPETGANGMALLVSGKGRCIIEGFNTNTDNSFWVGAGQNAKNSINNGDFADGDYKGWTRGGGGTVTVQDTIKKNGVYAVNLLSSITENPYMQNEVPCLGGQLIMGGVFVKADFTNISVGGVGTGEVNTQLDFYDSAGTSVGTLSFTSYTASQDWTWVRLGGLAPVGAAKCRLTISASMGGSGTGTLEAFWDSAILTAF